MRLDVPGGWRLPWLAAALLTFTACGEGAASVEMSLEDLGQKVCGDEWEVAPADYVDTFSNGEGGCPGVAINVFSDDTARDNWADMAEAGGMATFLVGPNWIVETDRARLEELQAELGGEIRGG